MIVFHPRVDVLVAIHFKFVGVFPGAVEDAEVNMRPFGEFAWLAGAPRSHVSRRNDRLLRAEDWNERLAVFRDEALP